MNIQNQTPASLIKDLKDQTGLSLKECKDALKENDNNIEQSIIWLRKKGILNETVKTNDKVNGIVYTNVSEDKKIGVILELNCKSREHSQNEKLKKVAEKFSKAMYPVSTTKMDEFLELEELKEINPTVPRFHVLEQPECFIAEYNHNGKIGVLVAANSNKEIVKDIAMHIAAANPLCLEEKDIPEDILNREKEIFNAQAQDSKKPPQIIEKIVAGKIKKFVKENTLLNQNYIKNPELTIKNMLEENNIEIKKFIRFQLGEKSK